jgi:hypothetical protein
MMLRNQPKWVIILAIAAVSSTSFVILYELSKSYGSK